MKRVINVKKTSQNCIVLVSHRIDESSLRYLSYLQREADGIMDFIILYDCSICNVEANVYQEFDFHFFDSGKVKNFFHYGNNSLPNPLLALLDMMKNYNYEHYLLMESDVVLSGNFRSFLEIIDEADCDYVHIAMDMLGKAEAHWPYKYIHDNPFKYLYFSWCQILYASRQLLLDIDVFIKVNDSFYYEFLLPTMAYNKNYTVRQFENFGYSFQLSWGPAEVYEYKYQYERKFNTFYHPIKNLSIVDIV